MNDDQIRQEAERRFRVRTSSSQVEAPATTRHDAEELIDELHIQQIELRRYARLYELAPVGYLTVRPDGRILSANRSACDMAGTDRTTLIRSGLLSTIHNSYHSAVIDLLRDVAAVPDRRTAIDVCLAGEDQRYVHIDAVCAEEECTSGQEVHLCLTDVTREKLAEASARTAAEQSKLLLRELNHRVKNNLQLLLSLIMLQRGRTEDPAAHAALVAVEERVRAVTFAHQSLDPGCAASNAELVGLLEPLVRQFGEQRGARIDFTSSVEELLVDGNAALSLALAVNELVSNAVKHAVTGDEELLISIRLEADLEAPVDGAAVRLCVRDSGPGLPPELLSDRPSATSVSDDFGDGLGYTLVDQLVRQQLRGRWTRRNHPAGGAEHCIEVVL